MLEMTMIATIIEATSELKLLLARRRNLGRIIDDLFGMELVTIWLGVRLLLVGLAAEICATTKSRLFDDIVVVFVVVGIVVLLLVVTNRVVVVVVVVVAEWYATVCT